MPFVPSQQRGHGWAVPMTMGILMAIVGVFALFASYTTSIVSVIFLGVLLIVVGVMEVVAAFRMHRNGPFLSYFLAGVLAIVCGALFLDRPMVSLASITLLLAGYLFASALFRGINAAVDRYPGWGWDLAYAIVAALLGVYIVASWPQSAVWVLGTVVAAEIIARGIALIAASWVVRDIEHGARPGAFAAA